MRIKDNKLEAFKKTLDYAIEDVTQGKVTLSHHDIQSNKPATTALAYTWHRSEIWTAMSMLRHVQSMVICYL